MPKSVSKYTVPFPTRLTPEQHDFLAEKYGNMSDGVRKLIDAARKHYGGELSKVEVEFADAEKNYLALKTRLEELREETKQRDDDLKTQAMRIEEAHGRLLEALKLAYWKPEGIQKASYKIYAEFTGLSVKELMEWVQEQAKRRDEIE